MSQSTLDEFLSNTRTPKRRRSSPEAESNKISRADNSKMEGLGENILPSWLNEMKTMMKSMKDQMDRVATKEDLNKLDEKVEKALSAMSSMEEEIKELKEENRQLKQKLEDLDNRTRRNNLIFRGVPTSSDYEKNVKDICKNILELKDEINIVRAFPIGRGKSETEQNVVFVECASNKEVSLIMSKIRKTKDTGINIQQDFGFQTRERRKKLLSYRREIIQTLPDVRIRLNSDIMTVMCNGKSEKFKWSDGTGLLTTDGKNGLLALKQLTGHDFADVAKSSSNINNSMGPQSSSQGNHNNS